MNVLPLSKVYQLIEPGRVVLLTTTHDGALNVMTMSWQMMVDLDPPLIACVVSNRDHSFVALRTTKKCLIAIPPVEVAAFEPRQFVNRSRSGASRKSNVNGLREWWGVPSRRGLDRHRTPSDLSIAGALQSVHTPTDGVALRR